jgi:hypothetical protein
MPDTFQQPAVLDGSTAFTGKTADATSVGGREDREDRVVRTFWLAKRDELRTPARAIAEYCQMILGDAAASRDPEFVKDVLKMLDAAVELQRMTDEILGPQNSRCDFTPRNAAHCGTTCGTN